MPSNECTNNLMELSFAVGNMLGAEACDRNDYIQLREILRGWDCSNRGKAGDAQKRMLSEVDSAIKACGDGQCPPSYCEDIWLAHNELVNSSNLFDASDLGRAKRGPVPPKVKGQAGVQRELTLAQLRQEGWPASPPLVEDTPAPATGTATAAAARYGSYGNKEGKRWYPQRQAR